MKQGVAKVKERYNWPVTILLIIGIVLIILLPLYMALMDRHQGIHLIMITYWHCPESCVCRTS